jgi:succinylglutamate desuccinylase
LLVSVLLHGNEDSGVVAMQRVLRNYTLIGSCRGRLSLLVGNVAAARVKACGGSIINPTTIASGPVPNCTERRPEHVAMSEVHRIMREPVGSSPASISTITPVINPLYCVVNSLDQSVLHLALLFSRTVVWFRGLAGSQTTAFSPLCPSLTLECGKAGKAGERGARGELHRRLPASGAVPFTRCA